MDIIFYFVYAKILSEDWCSVHLTSSNNIETSKSWITLSTPICTLIRLLLFYIVYFYCNVVNRYTI